MSSPISLSDEQMTTVMRLCEPLAPPDRSAFLHSLAQLLRSEPEQPPGDGAIHRVARQLLATGHYKLGSAVAVGTAPARHEGRRLGAAGEVRYRFSMDKLSRVRDTHSAQW